MPSAAAQNVQQFALRAVPTSSSASLVAGGPSGGDLASFGTLIILDGVPVSNNANLQSTGPRGELQFLLPSSAGGGVDLRRIPASTIERVEVIRGIPSARYGDLTQGVIIVDTRAGAVEPQLAGRFDARTFEGSFVGGRTFATGRHAATANVDVARTRIQPGLADDIAVRVSAQAAHRLETGADPTRADGAPRLSLDSRLDYFQVRQNSPEDPEAFPGRGSSNRDRGFRLSERAHLAVGDYAHARGTLALDYTAQRSFLQSLRIRPAMPFTDRLDEGRSVGRYCRSRASAVAGTALPRHRCPTEPAKRASQRTLSDACLRTAGAGPRAVPPWRRLISTAFSSTRSTRPASRTW